MQNGAGILVTRYFGSPPLGHFSCSNIAEGEGGDREQSYHFIFVVRRKHCHALLTLLCFLCGRLTFGGLGAVHLLRAEPLVEDVHHLAAEVEVQQGQRPRGHAWRAR